MFAFKLFSFPTPTSIGIVLSCLVSRLVSRFVSRLVSRHVYRLLAAVNDLLEPISKRPIIKLSSAQCFL